MNYNVKTIEYLDSIQVRTYKRPVTVSNKITLPQKHEKKITVTKKRTPQQIQHSIESSLNRTVNQIYALTRANRWEYFITLTIDPKKLDSTDFNLVSEKLNIWTNNLKKRYAPDLKYILVPELHKDKEKWHFHGLFAGIGKMPLSFSGKTCIGKFVYDYVKKPYATKIYNLPLWKYGYSTATMINDTAKASSYITKYITKDMTSVLQGQHRYLASQNTDRPVERVFNVDYKELENIFSRHLASVNYMSNVKISSASQEILYMEFNKSPAPAFPVSDFKLFEPEPQPVTVPNLCEKPKETKKYDTTLPSGKTLTGEDYLNHLREFKKFLKDNPELRKLYSDINIDLEILRTKKKMMDKENKAHE